MNESTLASFRAWLVAPMDGEVSAAIDRLRRAADVQHIAVMPDVHLASDVCVGVAVATTRLLYPQAVGGDIGCGMLAVRLGVEAARLQDPGGAGRLLARIAREVPARRRNRDSTAALPDDLAAEALSHGRLEAIRRREADLEFATLGSGNHFIELQEDQDGQLWLMVHSGSRGIGPRIRDHHMETRSESVGGGWKALDANSEAGQAYLHDVAWARRFADANRRAMAERITQAVAEELGCEVNATDEICSDHNHVASERHAGRDLWVHRKGAMRAQCGEAGALPGSMGSSSFHVEGRGCAAALCSSAHGAGRIMSRAAARQRIGQEELRQQMSGVWYDWRQSDRLRDEAPSAYKDIRAVLRAQRDLVKIVRVLRPVLNYKGV
jgi:tRNA-splicing ligase RtcB (3'-phosphate/5'-hydroxy nucleic acid ligase)